jgi:hypothetical protein
MMTNEALANLKAGDTVRLTCNGRTMTHTLTQVDKVITCCNKRSGAYGHSGRLVEWATGSGGRISTSVLSDEYLQGAGYPTHNALGERIRGWEIIN